MGISAAGVVTSIAYSSTKTKIVPLDQNNNNTNFYVNVKGEVEQPNKYYFNSSVSMRVILSLAKPTKFADLDNIDINKVFSTNQTIFIPKKSINKIENHNKKISWNSINNEKDLTDLGIRPSIAKKLVALRKRKQFVQWSDIEKISGIGPKTLEQLKNILVL